MKKPFRTVKVLMAVKPSQRNAGGQENAGSNAEVTKVIEQVVDNKITERESKIIEKAREGVKDFSDEVKALQERAAEIPTKEMLDSIVKLVERTAEIDFDALNTTAQKMIEREAAEANKALKNLTLDALAERAAEESIQNPAVKNFINRTGGVNAISLRDAAPVTMASIANTQLVKFIDEGVFTAKVRKLEVFNYFRKENISVPKIDYAQMTPKDGETAIVAEGVLKPQLDVTYTGASAEYDTIAGFSVFSEKILRDYTSALREVIEYTMKDAYKKLEYATVYGGVNINGIVENASAYNLPTLVNVNSNPQLTDCLRAMREQIIALQQNPDTILIPATLLAKGELARDAVGRLLDEKVAAMFPDMKILTFVPKAGDENKVAVLDSDYFRTRLRKPVNGNDPEFDIVIERQADDLTKNQMTARTEIFAFGYHPALANAFVVYEDIDIVKAAIAEAIA